MIVTEKQAIEMRCCQFDKNCIGPWCMAWTWDKPEYTGSRVPMETKKGYCGLVGFNVNQG